MSRVKTCGRLFRIEMGPGGKAGRITQLKTTPGFEHADGMRAYGANGLPVVEGATAGRFDIITLNGDNDNVKLVKGGSSSRFRSGKSATRPGCWKASWRLCSTRPRNAASPGHSAPTRWSCPNKSRQLCVRESAMHATPLPLRLPEEPGRKARARRQAPARFFAGDARVGVLPAATGPNWGP
jgi:hypothetical protein